MREEPGVVGNKGRAVGEGNMEPGYLVKEKSKEKFIVRGGVTRLSTRKSQSRLM